MKNINVELMGYFTELGRLRDRSPDDAEVQWAVDGLRAYITSHFYNCTPEILAGLGQMYAAGGEMTDNINKAGGDGTAEFAAEAIEFYCKAK